LLLKYGQYTSNDDVAKAKQIHADVSTKIKDFQARAQNLTSSSDQEKLAGEIKNFEADALTNFRNLEGFTDAQHNTLGNGINTLTYLYNQVKNIPASAIQANFQAAAKKEADEKAQKAAQERADVEAKNAEENAKTKAARDEEVASRTMDAADKLAEQMALAAASRGETSSYLADRIAYVKTAQAKNPLITDPKADPKDVSASYRRFDDLQSQLASLKEAENRVAGELTRYKIQSLKEQEQLVEAQGRKRLAELEARTETEIDAARERKKIEDDVASQKLDIQNRIADLESETDLDKKIRLTEYETEQIESATRVAAAQKNAAADAAAKINALPLNTDFLRTAYEAPLHHGGVDVPTQRISWIDQWRSQAAVPVGGYRQIAPLPMPARNPASAVASQVGSAPSGQGAPAPGSQGDDPSRSIDHLGSSISGNLSRLTMAINRTIDAVGRAGDKAVKAAEALTKKVAQTDARIERINRS
jgi:hypothetical protein